MAAHQDGRDIVAAPGDVYLLDPRRPFALEVGTARSLVLKVPRAEMEARLGELTPHTATLMPRGEAVSALPRTSCRWPRCAPTKSIHRSAAALHSRCSTASPSLSGHRSRGEAFLAPHRHVDEAEILIEARVRDPELKLTDIAMAAGISVRYANALLAQESTSLERFIMLRRLQHCRQALEDPSQLGRTVGNIAYSCGFGDLSHFSPRYKAQFGCSPGESRPPRR